MLRLLTTAVVAAVLLAGSAAARPVTGGSAWKLVQTTGCAAPKRVVGLACWDPADSLHTDKWQVGPSSATLNTPAYDLTYKYVVPTTLPPAGAQVQLTATVTSRDPGGASDQVCISSGFTSGDTCARASVPGAGQTKTGGKAVRLTPYRADEGAKATVIVVLQDGGRLYYTYQAEAPEAGKVSLAILARQVFNDVGDSFVSVDGTFSTKTRLSDCKRKSCSLQLTPIGTHYGLHTDENWHDLDNLRIRFRVVSGRIDKGPGTKLAADVVGTVVSVSSKQGSGPEGCRVGSQVGVYAYKGVQNVGRAERAGVSFGCGADDHVYKRQFSLKVAGSAITG